MNLRVAAVSGFGRVRALFLTDGVFYCFPSLDQRL